MAADGERTWAELSITEHYTMRYGASLWNESVYECLGTGLRVLLMLASSTMAKIFTGLKLASFADFDRGLFL